MITSTPASRNLFTLSTSAWASVTKIESADAGATRYRADLPSLLWSATTMSSRAQPTMADFVCAVSDNGCGLPKDLRDSVTEPYVTSRENGTGLGLAIVNKIMEDHGGNLLLEDAPGGGTRASMTFPRNENETDDETISAGDAKPVVSHGA